MQNSSQATIMSTYIYRKENNLSLQFCIKGLKIWRTNFNFSYFSGAYSTTFNILEKQKIDLPFNSFLSWIFFSIWRQFWLICQSLTLGDWKLTSGSNYQLSGLHDGCCFLHLITFLSPPHKNSFRKIISLIGEGNCFPEKNSGTVY